MKRFICFMISVILFLYGGCYIEKHGTDELPTKEEFVEYLTEKKDTAVTAYHMVKEWFEEEFEKGEKEN